jgi:cytochrome c oxidase assembly protein subunit 15
MTVVLAVWIWMVDRRRWVRYLSVIALVAVCLQGLLGGLRVTLYKDELGIFHALLAQAFLCAVGILSVATSAKFLRGEWDVFHPDPVLKNLVLATTAVIFLQLGLGATMRHEHAGLSIPDFPLAYGQWIPETSPAAISAINVQREAAGEVPTNALYIWMQMAHRAVAVLILAGVIAIFHRANKTSRLRVIKSWSAIWLILVLAQAGLGAWTIWSNKAADIATTHMALGALILLFGALFSFRLCRGVQTARFRVPEPSYPPALASTTV